MRETTLIKNVLYAIDCQMISPISVEYRSTDDVLDNYTKYDYSIERAILFLRKIRKTWMYKVKAKYENLGGGYVHIYILKSTRFSNQCFCMKFRINNELWGYDSVFDHFRYGVIGSKDI